MTQTLADRRVKTAGVKSSTWPLVTAVASALLIGASLGAQAGDASGFISGVDSEITQAARQPLPDPPPAAQNPAAAVAETRVADATSDAPWASHVGNPALLVKSSAAPASVVAIEVAPSTNPDALLPAFPPHLPYANARFVLMALGYGPAAPTDAAKCDSKTDTTCFPERSVCAKTGGVQCDFLWRRDDQLIKVTTVAVPPTVVTVECQANCGK